MSAPPNATWTAERYLAFERESDQCHEFLNGQLAALARTDASHCLLIMYEKVRFEAE